MMTVRGEHEHLGDFYAFFAKTYYPCGGLADCVGLFDYLEDAWEARAKARGKSMTYDVMHVVNARTNLVYDVPNQTKGVDFDTWIARQREEL
jgi:hypothetical protein